MRRVLVTGGSGFIGTNLVAHHIACGDQVLNLDIAPPRQTAHVPNWQHVNLLDAPVLERTIAEFEPQVVLHMADLRGVKVEDYAANTIGVSNLIGALRPLRDLRLAVFASSMLVCRIGYQPSSEDDYSPSTAYDWYVHPRGRRIPRNYGFVLNAVHQIDRLVSTHARDLLSQTLYLADYQPIELSAWACLIQRELHARPVREVPLGLLRAVARFGDVLKVLNIDLFPMNSFRLNNLLTDCLPDTSPLEQVVGPLPYDLPSAVHLTGQWMRSEAGLR